MRKLFRVLIFLSVFILLAIPSLGKQWERHTEQELLNILQKDSTNQPALFELEGKYVSSHRYKEAEKLLNKGLEFGFDTAQIYYSLGFLYEYQDMKPKAREYYQKIIEIKPDDAYAWRELSRTWESEDTSKTIAILEKGISKIGFDPTLCEELGNIYRIQKEPDKINDFIKTILSSKPLTAREYYSIGEIYKFDLNDNVNALIYFEKTLNVSDPTTNYALSVLQYLPEFQSEEKGIPYCKRILSTYKDPRLAYFIWNTISYAFYRHQYTQPENLIDILILCNSFSSDFDEKKERRDILFRELSSQSDKLMTVYTNKYKTNPQEPEILWGMGILNSQSGNTEEALKYLLQLNKSDTKDPSIPQYISMIYERMGNTERSISYLEKTLSLTTASPKEYTKLAELYKQEGNILKVDKVLSQLTTLYRQNPEAFEALGDYYNRTDQTDKALLAYKSAAEYSDLDYQYWDKYIECLKQQGKTEEVEKLLISILKRPDFKTDISPYFHYLLGYYAQKWDVEKMLETYDLISAKIASHQYTGNLPWQFMNPCQDKKLVPELISLLEKRLASHTLDKELAKVLAEAYNQTKQSDKLAALYEVIQTKSPTNEQDRTNMIFDLMRNKKWDKVIELCKQNLEKNPMDSFSNEYLLDSYTALGQKDKVDEVIQKLLKSANNNPEIYSLLGNYYSNNRNISQAIEMYKKAISLSPNDSNYKIQLAWLYSRTTDYTHAIEIYESIPGIMTPRQPIGYPEENSNLSQLLRLYILTHQSDKVENLLLILLKSARDEHDAGSFMRMFSDEYLIPPDYNYEIYLQVLKTLVTAYQKLRPTLSQWQIADMIFREDATFPIIAPRINSRELITYLEEHNQGENKSPLMYTLLASKYSNRSPDKLKQLWERAIVEYPKDPEPLVQLETLYTKESKFKEAVPLLEKAVSMKENRHDKDLQRIYIELAILYAKIGEKEQATGLIKKILSLSSLEDEFIWFSIGNIYTELKDYNQALNCYSKLRSEYFPEAILGENKIQCYLGLGQYAVADSTVRRLALNNRNKNEMFKIYKEFVVFYNQNKDYEKELDYFLEMIKCLPPASQQNSALMNLLDIQDGKEHLVQIRQALEKRVKVNPEDILASQILTVIVEYLTKV